MLYPLLRSALFQLDAERAHNLALPLMNGFMGSGAMAWTENRIPQSQVECLGMEFRNPVGLAAGLDKNGDYLDGLSRLGFGFCEIGTVTPLPQAGNDKPRLFRVPKSRALINRMGFNNKGVDHLVEQVGTFRSSQSRARIETPIRLGINIGKNKQTPNEKAVDDYITCLRKVYTHADYITVNISSPNTPGLRELQLGDARRALLQAVRNEQLDLQHRHQRQVPILVKIAPDMHADDVTEFADDMKTCKLDGVIATNTSNNETLRSELAGSHASETGGISGEPVRTLSQQTLQQLKTQLNNTSVVVAAGGIMSAKNAQECFNAGATLVQIYTGLIYQGPSLIRNIVRAHQENSQ